MRTSFRLAVAMLCGLALLTTTASAETKKTTKTKSQKAESAPSESKLPEKVRKTFDGKFPNAKIEKLESEKEGGIVVYDIEFREGKSEKETDIAEDGTMLEITYVISKKSIPKAAMAPIEAAAKGAKMGRTERIEVTHETKDGKVVKLDKPATRYAVEMTKGDENAEITVDAKGKVVEEPKWQATKKEAKKSA